MNTLVRLTALVCLLVGPTASAQQQRAAANLVGTWRLLAYENIDGNGRLTRPYGHPPLGFFVYDGAGNVFIQISRNPPLSRLPASDSDQPMPGASNLTLREALESYVAYFGTYAVDPERGEIIHRVTSDMWRDYTGSEQRRPFHLVADTLVISDAKTYRRVLVRVSPR